MACDAKSGFFSLPPLIQASLGAHALAAGTSLAAPQIWPWTLSALALNHALITIAGLWPRSRWLGANILRLGASSVARGEIALTIDDGPHPELTPRVLDLLSAHDAQATFFCIAQHAERHPTLTREIISRGHSVQNHTYNHRLTFSMWGCRAIRRELQRAQDTLSDITGQRPAYFRAPAGLRNVFLEPVLQQLQLQLVSWTRRGYDTRDAHAPRVIGRLTHHLSAGDILLIHDCHAAHDGDGRPVLLSVLPALLNCIDQAGLRCVTLPQAFAASMQDHPRDLIRAV